MTYFLLSIVGFVSAHRIISQLEKFFFVNRKKSLALFTFLVIPIYFFVVIKEQLIFFSIYIGLFLLSLIFFSQILEKKLRKVFSETHLSVLNGLILQLKAGYSPQKSISESFLQFTALEKRVYEPLIWILKPEFEIKMVLYPSMRFFFTELGAILKSETQIIPQLEMFKQGLKVKNKFISRTQQVTRQIKAQAAVSALIYGVIFLISYVHLSLMDNILTVITSLSLFFVGLVIIFKMGNRIRWTL